RPLRALAPDMAAHTAPGARVILSGILTRQAQWVESVYTGWGFAVERRIVIGEWITFTLRRL
ncbi:MAG: 50S ribosomal protein L11 methyltransferase, partial [Rubricella sp.]